MSPDNTPRQTRQTIRDAFPQLEDIDNEDLQKKVVRVWMRGLNQSEYESISEPEFGSTRDSIQDETLVRHTTEVTEMAMTIADELLANRPLSLDRDSVIAGALLHDVSKLYESYHGEETEVGERIPHPHYAVHLLAAEDIPVSIQHTILAHTHATSVSPQTGEAYIVMLSDMLVADATFWDNADCRLLDVQAEYYSDEVAR